MPIGYRFQPGQQMDTIPMGGGGPGVSPQSPAKILSLRLPRNLGQSPVAARQLLAAPGAGGSVNLNAIIAALMRVMSPQATPGGQLMPQQAQPLTGAGMAFPGRQAALGALGPPRITVGEEGRPTGDPGIGGPLFGDTGDSGFLDRTGQQQFQGGQTPEPASSPQDLWQDSPQPNQDYYNWLNG